jgi:hypothetical protein
MASRVAELKEIMGDRSSVAKQIAEMWDTWNTQRSGWLEQKHELRSYVTATDTTTTSNDKNGWKNKTTLPKLCQIRDNLHANYLSGLLPNDDWLQWEAYTQQDNERIKRDAIQAYMSNKMRESGVREVLSQLLYDYIDYGNAFSDVEYVRDISTNPKTGEVITRYVGPRMIRISPEDIVFNPYAYSFKDTPKIVRYMRTVADLAKQANDVGAPEHIKKAAALCLNSRKRVHGFSSDDFKKAYGLKIDKFGDLAQYFKSGFVEILELEGDLYDSESGEVYPNHVITVVDRMHVVRAEEIPSWLGSTKRHVGWRKRPDNLWAMGPLDNLVGMQYRVDHLENIKADLFDFSAFPLIAIKGDVQEFVWQPGEKVFLGEDGSVDVIRIEGAALQADNQIAYLQQQMEQFAGAPQEAMGIRSPGEKTMYEVQQLMTGAGRIFQEKITTFEICIVEPSMNDALEVARREMDTSDIIRVMDDDIGAVAFMSITKDDITARGKLRAVGARHFSAKAQTMQNLLGVVNSALWQDIKQHFSKLALAKMVEDAMQITRFGLVQKDVMLFEDAQTQMTMGDLQNQMAEDQAINPEEPI